MTLKSATARLAVLLVLSSCSSSPLDTMIDDRRDLAESRIEVAKAPAAEVDRDPLQVTDSVWLGDSALQLQRGKPLPTEWESGKAIGLRSDNPISLAQIGSIISSQTRIPVRLTGGADSLGTGGAVAAAANAGGGGAAAAPQPAPGTTGQSQGMTISYEGSLSGLLNMIAAFYNVDWNYDGAAIEISRYQTRTFAMEALPGSISTPDPASTGATGGAAGAGSAANLASPTIDIWADISSSLQALLGGEGSFTISQSSGTVVVTTTADRMSRVSSYLSEQNRRLSQQVAINIELYSVEISNTTAYGLDLTGVFQSAGWPTMSLSGVTSGVADAGNISITLVDPPAFAGSRGIGRALSTLGRTTRLAQIPITTLNNRPATQNISNERAYVSEISVTTSGGATGTTTTDVSTDKANSGISVTVLPRIMADGRVLLQYALSQGQLLRLVSFPAGDNTVQLPETQGLSFSQQALMKNGSTLILAGFDQSDASSSGRGVGSPITWLLGGSKTTDSVRRLVVIAITPREIQVGTAGAS